MMSSHSAAMRVTSPPAAQVLDDLNQKVEGLRRTFDYWRFRSTTSWLMLPRVITNRFPSGDQWKLKIRPEVNLVNCFGAPPAGGCSHTLTTPFSFRRNRQVRPSCDHRYSAIFGWQSDRPRRDRRPVVGAHDGDLPSFGRSGRVHILQVRQLRFVGGHAHGPPPRHADRQVVTHFARGTARRLGSVRSVAEAPHCRVEEELEGRTYHCLRSCR